ncbi:MauE/DoxX family redox-associated membrane protein [Paenibacillus sp. Leaf72]|uniref:MauE/DoxX family redox-associated membrane protein n=1 Tax=Paenibacillus sp. Leaf72 TaxID=1736234 RepID=UPI0007006941|nr:MauE/DoxX family redox-associated membrane protein [Paenibacillus sp. Leaf72]KQO10864.1 hypothetical protein ASF12_10800 [Paenibacillus sp. Leaf72]
MVFLLYTANIIIAVSFLLAFNSKLRNIFNFQLEISSYNILPFKTISIAARLVIGLELLLAIAFIFDLWEVWRQAMSIILLVFFSIITWRKNRGKAQNSCSCFGEVSFLNKNPLLRNGLLILFVLITMYNAEIPINTIVSLQLMFLSIWLVLLIEILFIKNWVKRI